MSKTFYEGEGQGAIVSRRVPFVVIPFTPSATANQANRFILAYLTHITEEADGCRRLHFSDGTSALAVDSIEELETAINKARSSAMLELMDHMNLIEYGGFSTDDMRSVIGEIVIARIAQDQEHGGPEHDDTHSWVDWKFFMLRQLAKLRMPSELDAKNTYSDEFIKAVFIKVAALAVAGLQSLTRKEKRTS